MPQRPLVLILAAGLGLAAQPAKPQARESPAAARGAVASPEEEKANVKAIQSGTYLLLKSGPLSLVLEQDRYSLFDSTLRILVDRSGSARVALSDGLGRTWMEKKEGADEAAYWKSILASGTWELYRQCLDPKDLEDLIGQVEALMAVGAGKEPPPAWVAAAAQVLPDLGWMVTCAARKGGASTVLPVETAQVREERKESGVVLHVESHAKGFVSLRLSMDATGMDVGVARFCFGSADYHLRKTRQGKAIRTTVAFSAGRGPEVQYDGTGPWALVPAEIYPGFVKTAAAQPFAAVDLASARALVAQLLADGTRAPMLRNPMLKCIQADLDAIAAHLVKSTAAVTPQVVVASTGGVANQQALIVSFAAGDLNLGFHGNSYAIVNSKVDVNVERDLGGRLVISGSLGSWAYARKPREASEEAFWKQVMAAPGGAAIAKALAPRDLADLRAQVERRLYEGMRKTPLPAWVPVAGMVWADLGRMMPKEGVSTPAPAQRPAPASARGLFLEERKEAAPKPAPVEAVAAVAAPALPSPVAVPAVEEKAPAEADPWRAESSHGDRIVIRPAGYDLHLGGLRVAYLRGGSGPDAWATYYIVDREGHIHGRSVSFRARDPRPAKGEALLDALMEQHYDEFEMKPLVEAWLEDGAHRMNRHLDRASLEELEGLVQDRLEALAAVDPRPADLAATFLAYMELLRFNTHLRAIDKETVD